MCESISEARHLLLCDSYVRNKKLTPFQFGFNAYMYTGVQVFFLFCAMAQCHVEDGIQQATKLQIQREMRESQTES